jgi:autotransporter-associated beta strand protein
MFNAGSTYTEGNSIGGSGQIIKWNAGSTITLSGANSYCGGTEIYAGTIKLGSPTALGSTAGVTLYNFDNGANMGVLDLNGQAVAEPITFTITNTGATRGGTLINSNTAAAASLAGSITLTWNGYFGGAGNTTLSGNIGGSGALVKQDSGTVTLSAANTYTGGTTINAGTLQFAETAALPTSGTAAVSSGATLAVNAGGSGEFTAATSGAGSIGNVLGTTSFASGSYFGIDTTNAGTLGLTYAGSIGGSLGFQKLGGNTLIFTAANTFTGTTAVSGGTLQLGDGVTCNGSVAGNITDNATLAFANPLSQAYSGAISGSGGLVSGGTGGLTLNGTNSYTGGTTVNAGALTATGAMSASGNILVNGGTLTVATASLPALAGLVTVASGSFVMNGTSSNVTLTGAVDQSGGAVTFTGSAGSQGGLNGAYVLSGGSFYMSFGNPEYMSSAAALFSVSGGTANIPSRIWLGNGSNTYGIPGAGIMDVSGGSVLATTYGDFNVGYAVGVGNAVSMLNVRGSGFISVPNVPVTIAAMSDNYNGGSLGQVNLSGGTLQSKGLRSSSYGGAVATFDFDGGVLRASLSPSANFMAGLSGAYVYPAGGTIDTNGQTITINQPLLAAAGYGVYPGGVNDGTITETGSGGAGYIAPPVVQITGTAGSTGYGAAAVADVSGGAVTGITITNPGQGYRAGESLTATFTGGGTSTVAASITISGSAFLQPISSFPQNGLTKQNSGTLVLTGPTSNYTGPTTVTAGTLGIGIDANLGNSNQIDLDGGALHMGGGISAVSLISGGSGYTAFPTVSGTGNAYVLPSCEIAGITISGTNFTTAPTLTISAPNLANGTTAQFTIAVSAGLATVTMTNPGSGYTAAPYFALSNTGSAVGAAASVADYSVLDAVLLGTGYDFTSSQTGRISAAGGPTLTVTETQLSTTLTAGRTITLDAAGGTLDVPGEAKATVLGLIDGGGGLSKTGSGTLVLTDATYTGGTSVTGGLLEIASASALPAGTSLTIGSGGGVLFDASGAGGDARGADLVGQALTAPVASDASASVMPVPEPGTLGLLAVGLAIVVLRRQCRAAVWSNKAAEHLTRVLV